MYNREIEGKHRGMVDLTAKQFTFINEWRDRGFDPGKRKEAALASGYSEGMSNNKTALIAPIRGILLRAMRQQGLTPERYSGKLAELLEAKKESGSPDNNVQLSALKLALDIEDAMPIKKVEVDQRFEQVNYSVGMLKVLEERTGERLIPQGRIVEGELVADDTSVDPL
jgi:hypothetical protein